jgi:hypothetical protein
MSKYYCRSCGIYIDDNKAQRLQHENGSKHKQAVLQWQQQAREKKKEELDSEKNVENVLKEIDRAAREDLAKYDADVSSSSDSVSKPQPQSQPRQYQPQRQERNPQASIHTEGDANKSGNDENEEGIYKDGEKYYMQGDVHVSKLQPGTLCELFVEELEAWVPASVTLRNDLEIPNVEALVTTLDVTYFPQAVDSSATAPGFAAGVSPELIRLECENYAVPPSSSSSKEGEAGDGAGVVGPVEESTGLGKWESVAVDEGEKEEVQEEDVEEEEEAMKAKKMISTHNHNKPSKRDYKGISLSTAKSVANESLNESGKTVGFKKKRKKLEQA